MPNWCEGNIRFRGTKENIKKFIENEIVYVVLHGEETQEVKPTKEENKYELILYPPKGEMRDSFYFRNTHRNFIFSGTIEVCWPDEEEDKEIVVIIDNFNSAWGFNDKGWADHAKKYNIDIRMFGIEQGMQFSQIMTITRDGNVVNDVKHYDDWNWECPFPDMGG